MPPVIHRHVSGGTTLIVIEDHARPVVQFSLVLRHGAAQDPRGQAGALATALELSLRGTEHRTREQFANQLEELGSSLFASAGADSASIQGFSLTRHLPATFDLLREAWLTPAMDPDERADLVEETTDTLRASRDDDDTVADVFLRHALYGDHPLSRSPWGTAAELAALNEDHLRAALQRHLVQGEVIAVLAGDITLEQATQLVSPWLRDLPAPGAEALREVSPPAPVPGLRITLVDKPERSQVQMRLARLTLPGAHPDSLPFWFAVLAFGGTFTSPFTHQVREVRGWSYHADASFDRWRRTTAPLYVSSAPAATDALDCLQLELALLEELAQGSLSDDLLARARAYVLNRFPLQLTTAGDLMVPAVRRELLGLPVEGIFRFPEELGRVSNEDVRAAARRTLAESTMDVVMVATASELEAPVRQRFPNAEVHVASYLDHL